MPKIRHVPLDLAMRVHHAELERERQRLGWIFLAEGHGWHGADTDVEGALALRNLQPSVVRALSPMPLLCPAELFLSVERLVAVMSDWLLLLLAVTRLEHEGLCDVATQFVDSLGEG